MLVSWDWLKDYVALEMTPEELEHRLTMAGLNHEGTEKIAADLAIDLEVTSNRPDCLGHLGVAREVAVLWDQALNRPDPRPVAQGPAVTELTKVEIDAPELCPRYTARVIQGVKIGPSPQWLADRLTTLGIAVINNVVDVTNYVLMECGQPLHAFDLAKLAGRRILVREAQAGEPFTAIDHRTYELRPGMCVIADASRPVALAGVMGGAETEVSGTTTELLIESAEFAPLATRTTARALSLQSPSSYRFERGVDPEAIDWASRRCCELILDLAGGNLADGVIDVGRTPEPAAPVTLRFSQLKRILGIDIPANDVRKIFTALGLKEVSADGETIEVIPPSWRRDLMREIDLVEEAARIHGYDKIPEDAGVAMVPSTKSQDDRVLDEVRHVLRALGFHEAMTISTVDESAAASFSPWTDVAPLCSRTPVLRRADRLRRSLVPSLLGSRKTNEALANPRIELFEIARVYLPRPEELPEELRLLALTSGEDYRSVKGVIESLVEAVCPGTPLEVRPTQHDLLAEGCCAELWLGEERLGFLGEVSDQGQQQFELRSPASVAEINLATLVSASVSIRAARELSTFPAVSRDLNMVCDEQVLWADVEKIVRQQVGELLERVEFRDVYRDAKRLGAGKKSLLFTVVLRSASETLTREKADAVRDQVVSDLGTQLGCELRA